MSEEIICSECGRPNLPEAEKCWYCQVLLKSGHQVDEEKQDTGIETHAAGGSGLEDEVEDIPEWLKRVRELKKADQPEEDEEDQWRQQILFESQAGDKSSIKTSGGTKPRSAPRLSDNKADIPAKKKEQALFTNELENSEEDISPEMKKDAEVEGTVEEESELPDGFTPLDTKKG